jgi:Ca2+-binding RTX toxin-like protein
LTTILSGNDTFIGSPFADVLFSFGGNDTLSGGGGNDSLNGGAGNDLISGDAGNDILVGGSGADVFHASTGKDLVLDFHISEGDRVQLDHGATFTLSQVGADTVIDLGGGNQMVLAGVQLSTLTPGWIFGS